MIPLSYGGRRKVFPRILISGITSKFLWLGPRNFVKRNFFKKMGHSRPLFLYFHLFNTQLTVNKCSIYIYINKFLPMTGFELWTSGIGSNRSTNWATTTAQLYRETLTSSNVRRLVTAPTVSDALVRSFIRVQINAKVLLLPLFLIFAMKAIISSHNGRRRR